jgi:murein DD-endopeptidase MepM/ murein hydrolase activator NlpD
MKTAIAAMIMTAALLAGCATSAPAPTVRPTEGSVAPAALQTSPTPLPTTAPTDTPTSTPRPTTTPTPEPTNTATSVPTYTLSGTVFFDYNGSGLRDTGEPPIEGVPIRVAGLSTSSGPDGKYSLAGVPAGSQQVYVESPSQEPATASRYINRFLGWVDIPAYEMNGASVPAQHLADTEVQPIDQPLGLVLGGDRSLDLGLTQGYLTLPFSESTDYLLWSYVDLDHIAGFLLGQSETLYVRNYANDRTYSVAADTDINSPSAHSGTSDNHQGIDYYLAVGTPLLAAASGTVVQAPQEHHCVRIKHALGSEVYVTGYGHNSVNLVSEGDFVRRGQIIALSGDWHMGRAGGTNPHVHWSLWIIPTDWGHNPIFYIFDSGLRATVPYNSPDGHVPTVDDPYRDVLNPEALSYWTVDNDPRFPYLGTGE